MSASRDKLKKALDQYITETFSYIQTVKEFSNKSSEWIETREAEIKTMAINQDKLKKINLSIINVMKSENTGEDLKEFIKNIKPGREKKKRIKLQSKLVWSLNQTRLGLKKLEVFLEAVEKLMVTSAHVFAQNQVLQLSDRADLESVQEIIFVAQLFCPLLLSFKRDNKFFFSNKIQNLDVMKSQLEQYIRNIEQICDVFRKSSLTDLSLDKPFFDLNEDISEEDLEKMFLLINKLHAIRMDEHFRMLFLFQDQYLIFTKEFSVRKTRMLQFHGDLVACAAQLDNMIKGAKISNVVDTSVEAASLVLSIVGLALIPVTAGVSVVLTGTGAVLEGLTRTNSLVTKATAKRVNSTQRKKATETFGKFKKDVNVLQNHLNEVIYHHFLNIKDNPVWQSLKMTGRGVLMKNIDAVVDHVSALKAPKVMAKNGTALSNVSRAASNIPNLGKAAVKGPLAARGLNALSSLFLGMDVFCIVKDSRDLSNGCETEVSKWIRARAALWKSEIDSWQKIYYSLEEGRLDSKKKQQILKTTFYQDVPRVRGSRSNNIWSYTSTVFTCVCVCFLFQLILFLYEVVTAVLSYV